MPRRPSASLATPTSASTASPGLSGRTPQLDRATLRLPRVTDDCTALARLARKLRPLRRGRPAVGARLLCVDDPAAKGGELIRYNPGRGTLFRYDGAYGKVRADRRAPVAIPGSDAGSTCFQIVCHWVAPSAIEPSRIDGGTARIASRAAMSFTPESPLKNAPAGTPAASHTSATAVTAAGPTTRLRA